jgi:SAM-dependent methyltransferase
VEQAYAARYRTLWERHWWWRSREALLISTLERLTATMTVERILDVGCGDGLFFPALERFGAVDGLEPDASLLADSPWRDRIKVGSLDESFQVADSYDLLLMLDVLEHIADDRAALDAAFRAMRSGAALVVTVPALAWLWSRHDEANEHYRRYSPNSLRTALASSGFVVESLRYFFAWTVGPMILRKVLAPAEGKNVRGASDYEVAIPPAPINWLLTRFSTLEHELGRRWRWPIGSTLLAVARRPS